MKLFLTNFFFLLFLATSFSAENRLIRIDFPAENRDQSGIIHAICQDYLGYIWIGQSNGLYRFDGYEYKKIPTLSESEFGISNNNINCIFEDSDSLLWIGTRGGGLNLYDRKTDSYRFFTSDSKDENQKLFNDIASIYEDSFHELWIGTDGGGLYLCNKSKLSFTPFRDPENESGSSFEKVLSIFRGSPDEILIGTWQNGLKRIDLKTGKWEQMFPDLDRLPLNSRRNIWSITDLGSGKLLLGTFGEGALVFDQNTRQCTKIKNSAALKVYSCRRDVDGTLYLSTDKGLEIVNDGSTEKIGNSDEIRIIYLDHEGHLWIGQQQNLWALKKIPSFFQTTNATTGTDCSTLFLDNQSTLWLAFPGKLVKYRNDTQHSKSIPIPEKIAVNMLSDWNDRILVLATNEGVLFFDKQSESFIQMPHQSPEFQEVIKGNAFLCAQTPDFVNWIGTLGVLYCGGKTEERFISEKKLPSFSMSHYVSSVIPNKDGSYWLGTFGGGLNHLNSLMDQPQVFRQKFAGGEGLSNNFIECLAWDQLHRLWIGTHDGLNLMTDATSGKFRTFTLKDGLPNNEINSMIADRNGMLWIGTSKGLCRLNVDKMEFRIFGIEDGLPSLQFLTHSAFLLSNGSIVMGTKRGAIQFNPENIPEERFSPEVFIQSVNLFNKEVHPAENSFLKQNALFTNSIRLNYNQNYFGVSFTSLPYFRKENTSYTYQLVGVDQAWQTTKSNSINYTNLLPGEYVLKIKSNSGADSSKERSLQIVIVPPWWKSKAAYWIYSVFFLLILFLGVFFLVKRERRNGQIRLQKYKAQKEHEMNDLKFAFFSQVSNELKNPLTLLMNPLNELISASNPEIKTRLSVMQSSAFQMNLILDQLVDFKKIGTGEYQPNLTNGSVFALLNRICLKYAACAKSGGKLFQYKISTDDTFACFDAALVTKIQGNVLDFFFNRSAENSEILFEATVISENENSFLSINVSDQLGRLTSLQLKLLLEPFSGGESETSSGFGLAITSELVKLCKGQMRLVNSDKGILAELKLPLIINQPKTSEKVLFENESNKPILLLVIGHAEMRTFLVESFAPDYSILEYEFAENALSMIEQKWPDFVICDFELKGINGLRFFSQFNENQKAEGVPFVLLCGDDDQSVKLDALRAGVHRFMQKPFNLDELKTIVHNHFITRKKLQKELTSDSHSIQLRDVEITDPQKELLDRLLNFMEKHYADPNLNVEFLCAELDMSRPQLYRKLQTLTGLSVQEFIKSFRLKKAAVFLRSGNLRISDIAYQTGFSDPQHFSKSFKIQFGISPTQYAVEHKD